jgi:CBS domain-containing protein
MSIAGAPQRLQCNEPPKESPVLVAQICTRHVVTCPPEASALEMARLMRERHVGDVVVVERRGDGKAVPVGIVTDRDLAVEVLAQGLDPQLPTARDLMGREIVTVTGSEPVHDALLQMRTRGIRRLPVVDALGALVGVVTADDALRFLAESLTEVARIAAQQVHREERSLARAA